MSAINDLRGLLGPDLGRKDPTAERADRVHWVRICICGHQEPAHASSIGGSYPLIEPTHRTVAGRPMVEVQKIDGCVGEMPNQKFERFTDTTVMVDGSAVITRLVNATCPCDEFRPVLMVDRPHRYFNQRRPLDRRDFSRHPLATGMRAYRTRIGKLKRAQVSDVGAVWADEEFDRRVTWIDGKRICSISGCRATDDVWPIYTSDADDRSELRCAKHR